MDLNARIYIAGHRGLVGTALMRNLRGKGYENFVTRTHAELDLTCQAEVKNIRVGQDLTIPDPVVVDVARCSIVHHVLIWPDSSARKLFDLRRLRARGRARCACLCEGIFLVSRKFLTHHAARIMVVYSEQI